MYKIMYQPRMDDPVVIARFESAEEALEWLDLIQKEKPQASKYHYMEEEK